MIYKVSFQNQLFMTYADTNLLFPAKKLETIESVINHEFKLLVQWFRNKLPLNETKAGLIIFRSPWKHLLREPDTRINNYKLKLHSHISYLLYLLISCCPEISK